VFQLNSAGDVTVISEEEAAITQRTMASYDSQAEAYADLTWPFSSFPGLADELAAFDSAAPVGARLLDLGCGAGRDSNYLAHRGRHVVAADLSEALLREARRRLESDAGRRVSLVRLDLKTLPFRDGTFGGVWASGSFLHLPASSFSRALTESARVLMPGGVAAISMKRGASQGWRRTARLAGERWFTFIDPESFAATMRSTGFVAVGVAESRRGNWFVASGRRPRTIARR
jgi:SAM-dependent methyltransferase